MSEEPEKADAKRGAAWPWIMAVLLVLYPLSMGPFAFLAGSGHIPVVARPIFGVAYAPLEAFGKAFPSIGEPIHAYAERLHRAGERYR